MELEKLIEKYMEAASKDEVFSVSKPSHSIEIRCHECGTQRDDLIYDFYNLLKGIGFSFNEEETECWEKLSGIV